MKETGIFTPEAFTAEMTEDLEKERRKLQLETCEVRSQQYAFFKLTTLYQSFKSLHFRFYNY